MECARCVSVLQKRKGLLLIYQLLALSPKAIARLESYQPSRPLPKIFRITKSGKVTQGVFKGATLNTPSMLALEDLHSALNWAESIGGLPALVQRCNDNFKAVDTWVSQTEWIDWLPNKTETLSTTSMCLKVVSKEFATLSEEEQQAAIGLMCQWLQEEEVAFDADEKQIYEEEQNKNK